MKQWSKFGGITLLAAVSAIASAQTAITPVQLFADNFESGNFSQWNLTGGNATGLAPSIVDSSTSGEVAFEGTKSAKSLGRVVPTNVTTGVPQNLSRLRYGAQFSRPAAADETVLLTFYYYEQHTSRGVSLNQPRIPDPNNPNQTIADPTNNISVRNQRYWVELRDLPASNSLATAGDQIVAIGAWQGASVSTLGLFGNLNGATLYPGIAGPPVPPVSIFDSYAARIFAVGFGNSSGVPVENGGAASLNNAPGWGYLTSIPGKSEGWKRKTIAYSVNRAEFFINQALGWFYNVNRSSTRLDAVVLNPTENPAYDVWVDNFSVRAFPAGSMNLLPDLSDVTTTGFTTLQSVPLTLELTPASGNTNTAVSAFTVNMDANREINMQLPADVRGAYELTIDAPTFLRTRISVNVTNHGLMELRLPLRNGDLNGDGIVDGNDVNGILSNFGSEEVPPTQGDLNFDGIVDGNDINVALANFGGEDQ